MIVLISGVLGISPDIYEAAEIDGANGVQTFFRITIPNLKTVLLYTLITSLVGGLNMFDIPFLFLSGGPDRATLTTSVFIYNLAFSGNYIYNRAAAASMLMWLLIAFFSAILFYIMRDKDQIKIDKEIKKAKKEAKRAAKGGVNQWQW
jgi:multiple sugar transport system permease protein